ncbi:MBOAT family O-acyltransferase [Harryflintia acetispora]|uniref:MBOAT family O-acyltransferase n=1 Tax=Harryflintia acetispora TaxID=1849041 RepID=UPI0018984661|nr:MBOAT family protein [Harryflintia acetispora]
MSILSFQFAFFVTGGLIFYYLVPKRFQWVVLIGFSIIFFISGCGLQMFLLMLGMVVIAWCCGLWVGKLTVQLNQPNGNLSKLKRKKNAITALGIIFEAGILIFIKDLFFFSNNINLLSSLLGKNLRLSLPEWAAPLGISYYTLMLISYILDISWGTSSPQSNPIKLLLYSIYFPQMTSGPITRYQQMEQELFTPHSFNYDRICFGLQRIFWGLFKELVIAERLKILANTIYNDYQYYSGIYIFIAAISYTLQLYTNFSGCMDCMLGVSELFGVRLPENFRTPFFSTSLSEVWRRWHMTLGFWVKDYILYPVLKSSSLQKLGRFCKTKIGKRAKQIPTYVGLFITWFTVGFWHGGAWKYIFGSGIFFFVMIVGGQLLEPLFKKLVRLLKINTDCFSWKLFQRLRTFLLFSFSVSFGRAASLKDGYYMWKGAFAVWNPVVLSDHPLQRLGVEGADFFVIIFGLLMILLAGNLQKKGSIRKMLSNQNLVYRWIILFGLIFSVIILGNYGPGYDAASFIYGQF